MPVFNAAYFGNPDAYLFVIIDISDMIGVGLKHSGVSATTVGD